MFEKKFQNKIMQYFSTNEGYNKKKVVATNK